MNNKIFLRKVTIDDKALIFEWANDEITRKNSFQTEKITWEEHCVWFEKKIHSQSTLFYILVDDTKPAGQIRLEITGDEVQINYSIAKAFRGKGLGKEIVKQVENILKTDFPYVKNMVAEVKQENALSKKVFEQLGYQKIYSVYKKAIDK